MEKKKVEHSIKLSVFTLFALNLFGTFYYKQLYIHGAPWLFRLYNFKSWVVDEFYYRYSSVLVQVPAILSSLLFTNPKLTTWVYCFSYFVYPFFVLLICYFYLIKKRRSDLIYPLIVTLFIAMAPTWAFSNSVVCESIAIFWMIYVLIICEEKPKLWYLAILGILLLLSYELGFVFYALAIYLLWREKKLTPITATLFILFILVQLLNIILHILPQNQHSLYISSLSDNIKSISFFFTLGVLLTSIFIFTNRRMVKMLFCGFILFFSIWASLEIVEQNLAITWTQSYSNRTWTIPVSFIILLSSYEYLRKNKFQFNSRELLFICILFIPGMTREIILTKDSLKLKKRFTEIVAQHKGCHVFSLDEQKELSQGSLFPKWEMPYFSAIIQGSNDINTMLFTDFKVADQNKDHFFCRVDSGQRELMYTDSYSVFHIYLKGKFNFAPFLKVVRDGSSY